MSLRRTPVAVGTAVLAALALAACGSPGSTPDAAADAGDDTLTIVASTDVYGSIASLVAGPDVTVESLIDDPAADPHSYESTPADAASIAEADIVILNGGGYDDFVTSLLESSGTDPVVLEVSEISGLEAAAEEEEHAEEGAAAEPAAAEEEHAEEEHGHEHGAFNEHVWYSLPTIPLLADRLATELGTLDSANAATYQSNAEEFDASVAELVERAAAIGASVPDAHVAVTEPVPGYLIEAAGLTDVTPEEFAEAVEEDTDPPAAVLAETLALFAPDSPEPVRALIVNAQTQTATTDQVVAAAQQVGTPVIEMTETLPEGATDYLTWMGEQVDALSAALNPV